MFTLGFLAKSAVCRNPVLKPCPIKPRTVFGESVPCMLIANLYIKTIPIVSVRFFNIALKRFSIIGTGISGPKNYIMLPKISNKTQILDSKQNYMNPMFQ